MKRALKKIRNLLKTWRVNLATRKHHKRLKQLVGAPESSDSNSYYEIQLTRTLGKKDSPLPERIITFVDNLSDLRALEGADVLCIGCRNVNELLYFDKKGAQSVIGIDLFSESPRIQIMDMHRMNFPDNRFDVVFSSHSLEHALKPEDVVKEIIRVTRTGGLVAIEVPVNYHTQGADLQDYRSLDGLLALFEQRIGKILLAETVARDDSNNKLGTDVIRVAFEICKS